MSERLQGQRLKEILENLADQGFDGAEVYVKQGRSRRLERTLHTETSGFHHERGWAVRATTTRASMFAVGTGEPPLTGPWPEPDGREIRLPEATTVPRWSTPSDFDAPLVGEREGFELLRTLAKELDSEFPGARLIHGLLEDGSSEAEIRSSRGVSHTVRSRLAVLRVEAVSKAAWSETEGAGRASLVIPEREARKLHPGAVARRLADLLSVRGAAPPEADRDRGEILLAPPVGRRLLAGLLPLLVGPRAESRISRFRDRRGKVASDAVTVIDDGRLSGGLLTAPVDGEGVPTREIVLIADGSFQQPLLAWDEARLGEHRSGGIRRRASFRDLPEAGPTHLYLKPDPAISVGSLVGSIARGYYLLDAPGPPRFDFDQDRFTLPVAGIAVRKGQAVAPVAGIVLAGAVSTLLRNVQAVARDLSFAPLEGMLGCPTVLISGLEIRRR